MKIILIICLTYVLLITPVIILIIATLRELRKEQEEYSKNIKRILEYYISKTEDDSSGKLD